MPRPLLLLLLSLVALPLVAPSAFSATPERAPASSPTSPASGILDDTPLQTRLHATPEEWSILSPKLDRIDALRLEVNAATSDLAPTRGMPGFVVANSSLEAPAKPMTGVGGGLAGFLGAAGPFDPKRAPGAPGNTGGVGASMNRAIGRGIKTGEGNSVQLLLTELRALLASPSATDAEIREKLATVRAARAKALRDLAAAQQELLPLLTLDQQAVLVDLGRLD